MQMVRHETVRTNIHQSFSAFAFQCMRQTRSFSWQVPEITDMNWSQAVARIKKHLKPFTIAFVHKNLPFIDASCKAVVILTRSKGDRPYTHLVIIHVDTAKQGPAAPNIFYLLLTRTSQEIPQWCLARISFVRE